MTEEIRQTFETVSPEDIPGTAEKLKAEGYRLIQLCGVTKEGCTELLYSFDVYENEVHDLFDVEFTDSKLDYKGNFFRMSKKAPWKGPEAAPKEGS